MGNICLTTANIPQAKIHFKKAMKIYENVWADEPELIQVQVDLYRVIRLLLGQKNNRLNVHTKSNHIPTKSQKYGQYFCSTNTARS